MCTALKNHCIKIDEALIKGQEDKDHLMLLNQERVQESQVCWTTLKLSLNL